MSFKIIPSDSQNRHQGLGQVIGTIFAGYIYTGEQRSVGVSHQHRR